jgi:hypothetical protein
VVKIPMAKCTKCGADITSTGYDTEEVKLPSDSAGYVVYASNVNHCWNNSRKIVLANNKEKREY